MADEWLTITSTVKYCTVISNRIITYLIKKKHNYLKKFIQTVSFTQDCQEKVVYATVLRLYIGNVYLYLANNNPKIHNTLSQFMRVVEIYRYFAGYDEM